MQKRSKKSSKRTSKATSKAADRPFDTAILKRARKVVSAYRIILEKDAGLGYIGSSIELPAVFADGATAASCVDAIQHALAYAVATMIECGQRPPAAASSGKRDVQINIRLTAQEKLRLSDTARRLGFKGVSDFVRLAALERTSAT